MLSSLAAPVAPRADEPPPVDVGLEESIKTELVLLDVFVLDHNGNAVPGLTRDDFELTVNGHETSLVNVDATCRATEDRQSDHASAKPKVVLLFDYQHLRMPERARAIEMARRTVARGTGDTSMMVAALTGSFRLEENFAQDPARVDSSLVRMEKDSSLFAGNFSHLTEDGFTRGLTSLFDTLATVPGPKAILLYSSMSDVPLDEQFRQLSAQAAASRCALYPVDVRGMYPSGPWTRSGCG